MLEQYVGPVSEKSTPKYWPHDKVEEEPPPTLQMLEAAVSGRQGSSVAFLLQKYPNVDLMQAATLLGTVLTNADLDIMQMLQAHQPEIVNFHFESHMEEALTQACVGGNPTIPLFLLEHGADPNIGGFGPSRGPLWYALHHGQPVEVVERMIQKGANVRPAELFKAIHARPDAIETLLRGIRLGKDVELMAKLQEEAAKTGDKSVIAAVEHRVTGQMEWNNSWSARLTAVTNKVFQT